jgi:hypothetical protein
MSDYRDPNDPMWRNSSYDPEARSQRAAWGWIAAAVFLIVALAVAFGVRHEPNQRAAANTAPPATTGLAPPPAAIPILPPAAPTPAPPVAPHP